MQSPARLGKAGELIWQAAFQRPISPGAFKNSRNLLFRQIRIPTLFVLASSWLFSNSLEERI